MARTPYFLVSIKHEVPSRMQLEGSDKELTEKGTRTDAAAVSVGLLFPVLCFPFFCPRLFCLPLFRSVVGRFSAYLRPPVSGPIFRPSLTGAMRAVRRLRGCLSDVVSENRLTRLDAVDRGCGPGDRLGAGARCGPGGELGHSQRRGPVHPLRPVCDALSGGRDHHRAHDLH